MVPRRTLPTDAARGLARLLASLFSAWRSGLTGFISRSRGISTRLGASSKAMADTVRSITVGPSGGEGGPRPVATLLVGVAASTVGAALSVAFSRQATAPAAAVAAVSVMWVVARLLAMRLASGGRTVAMRHIPAAWAAGALAQVIAFNAPLRLVAWGLGAALSYRYLRRAGLSGTDSRFLIGWGYGLEVAGFFALALFRNVHVAVLLFGGG